MWNPLGLSGIASALGASGVLTDVSISAIASTDEGDVGLTPANDLEILLFDNLFSPSGFDGGNWSITLEGLDPAVYDVFLYRAANVGVQTGLMSVNGVVAGNLAAAPTFPVAAVRGETFTSVFTVVGESGVLSIDGAGDGALSGLAGFQVVPAPEPTSAGGAVALALAALASRRRRRERFASA